MTIATSTRIAGPYVGNGTASTFAFAFKVFAASDLLVVRLDTSTNVQTTLALTTDYTVSLNADQNANPGGSITLVAGALASGLKLTITSSLAATQQTDLTNQGGFYPQVITNALDKLTILVQQLKEQAGRALTLPLSQSGATSTELPFPTPSNVIGWNATGTQLQNYDANVFASTVQFANWQYDTFTGDGVSVNFPLSGNPVVVGNTDVSIGGVTQTPGTDYGLSGTVINFTSAPPVGADILVRYGRAAEQLVNTFSTETYTATAGQTAFSLSTSYAPGTNNMAVYANGLRLVGGVDYIETNSNTVTLTAGAQPGDELTFVIGTALNTGTAATAVSFTQAGTGAVARSAQDKMREVVSVKDFGAVGDGVTDDTAAIQAAAAAAMAAGKALFLPAGTYLLSAQVSLTSALTIYGEGRGSVLKINPALSLANKRFIPLLFQATVAGALIQGNVTLRDFAIDGSNGGKLDAGLIVLNSVEHFVVDNLYMTSGGTPGAEGTQGVNGISVSAGTYGGASSSGVIQNCLMEYFTKAPINWTTESENGFISGNVVRFNSGNGQTPGIQVNGGYNCTVTNNFVHDNEGTGIIVATSGTNADTYRNPRRISIRGNHCYRNGTGSVIGHGIYVANSSSGAYRFGEIIVESNFCFDNGMSNTAANGIRVENEADVVVRGNNVYNNKNSGIHIGGADTQRIRILGNALSGNNLAFNPIVSITFDGSSTATVVTRNAHGLSPSDSVGIFGTNEFDYTGTKTVDSTPTTTSFTFTVTPSGTLRNEATGGLVVNYTTATSHRSFSQGSGIFVQVTTTGKDIEIQGNNAFDPRATKSQQYGVFFNSSTTLSNITVVGNTLFDNAVQELDFVSTLPDGVRIAQSWKKTTTSATATFPAILRSGSGKSYHAEFKAVGRKNDGTDEASYYRIATLHDTAGTVAVVGTVTAVHTAESNAAWDATIAVSSNQMRYQLTGVAATTINWSGEYEIAAAL